MEKLGMDLSQMTETRAAIVQQLLPFPRQMPRMSWSNNYMLYAAATMFTLFFAGDVYAPKTKVNGVNVQEWLQSSYVNAMRQVAR
jgi:hypothetical protein